MTTMTADSSKLELNHRHYMLAFYAASGASEKKISEELGMTKAGVTRALNKSSVRELVAKIQAKFFADYAEKRLKSILPKAIDTAEEIMEDRGERGQTRLTAAMNFMDRSLGRPTQKIESNESQIRNLIDRLDSMEQNQPKTINVTSEDDEEDDYEDVEEVPAIPLKEDEDDIDKIVARIDSHE